ncbi:polyprenyl synthetase family protein [Parafilimonas terrae]|uniref:Geranylgeranyl diphosphate synthase, type II n=1 Tax=Parafilimonas terrae TaxID=1465490 RepID=A0A1I5REL5_9BACT|nr:polyprenyl synthetase family protein [Parafilimonas terrae]SFP56969.1 geranylgeranyl diphosphate synthase, type II [Parafilimonas terrae]
MFSFKELSAAFAQRFSKPHFPKQPESLYAANDYFLGLGGKRIRPVMCLMGNELFDEIHEDAWQVATAVELFHNFTLIHDDIMDAAPLRRGFETVHYKYGSSTALLAGDVMLVVAYEYLNKISSSYIKPIINLFSRTAKEVCEGQQLDMDFEKLTTVSLEDYIKMIELKTSVLLAASLQMGAIIGGAGEGNCNHLYEFGKNLGIAFQVQDDYLDAFGDPEKFGKTAGGDIKQNKKTFLLIHALQTATGSQQKELTDLLNNDAEDKVQRVLEIFRDCNVDAWAKQLKQQYFDKALFHLEEIAVLSSRKKPLLEIAEFLIQRDY